MPNIVVILATMVPAVFLALFFPARTFDSEAPTEAKQLWARLQPDLLRQLAGQFDRKQIQR
jgi:hypothetical protein